MKHPSSILTLLITLALSSLSISSAHATLVLGTLSSQPTNPAPQEPFTLTLELVDPSQVPVEDAFVFAEFRLTDAMEPVVANFTESSLPGIYEAVISLPEAGTYDVLLRDQTFRQEEAQATVTFAVNASNHPEGVNFIFPPTATGPQSLATWLIWVIALPIVAAIVVTVVVLRTQSTDKSAPKKA